MTEQRRPMLLTTQEAALWLRLAPHTLENMRVRGTGPKFRKHGGRVYYSPRELKSWSDGSRRLVASGPKE